MGQKEPCALQCFRPPSSAAPCGLQARDHAMRGLRKGNVALSKAPVIPGARSADMAQGIERYPFQLYTHTRTGMVAWVLSGADLFIAPKLWQAPCWQSEARARSCCPMRVDLSPGVHSPNRRCANALF